MEVVGPRLEWFQMPADPDYPETKLLAALGSLDKDELDAAVKILILSVKRRSTTVTFSLEALEKKGVSHRAFLAACEKMEKRGLLTMKGGIIELPPVEKKPAIKRTK